MRSQAPLSEKLQERRQLSLRATGSIGDQGQALGGVKATGWC